jgi:hypothetical protein
MYGLPQSTDLSFLVGAEAIQVCVGAHSLQLQFSNEISIVCQCDMVVQVDGLLSEVSCDHPTSAVALFALLGNAIADIGRARRGDLILNFEAGTKLTVLDSSDQYESYVIWRAGDSIAV